MTPEAATKGPEAFATVYLRAYLRRPEEEESDGTVYLGVYIGSTNVELRLDRERAERLGRGELLWAGVERTVRIGNDDVLHHVPQEVAEENVGRILGRPRP